MIYIDFETYSKVDIKVSGGMAYAKSFSTNVICLAWAIDTSEVQLWTPADEWPDELSNRVILWDKVCAHNATFDFRIWNYVLAPAFNVPLLDIDQMVDSMALCGAFSLPLNLKDAGKALDISMPKSPRGAALIKKLCCPDKKGEQPLYQSYKEDFEEFFDYCVRDVEAMREVMLALPRQELTAKEQEIWLLTYSMNSQGLPIAYNEAVCIYDYLEEFKARELPRIGEITDGTLYSTKQYVKIKEWVSAQGYEIPNSQANTITLALEDGDLPENVREFFELMQLLGGSATAKFKRIKELAFQGYIHDNLVYHGAGTGRWTARGLQMQNLPRASVEDPEYNIKQFTSGKYVERPIEIAKALIRPMIRAPKGSKLIVSDYSSIENRVLHWLAGDEETLTDFRNGVDQYITMAASKYKTSYSEIYDAIKAGDEEAKFMRFFGKVIVLGCGYGMGGDTFKTTAKDQFGLNVENDEAHESVRIYRDTYPKVTYLWRQLSKCSVYAVTTGKKASYNLITMATATVNGSRWLAMQLPSGKSIYYKNPQVEQKYIPKYEHMGKRAVVTHEGRNPYTRKWGRLALIPGRITENAVQGTAREIMAQGMLNVQDRQPEVDLIGSVHDEALGLVNDEWLDGALDRFNDALCDIPWVDGCPIKAEGYISERYKKG